MIKQNSLFAAAFRRRAFRIRGGMFSKATVLAICALVGIGSAYADRVTHDVSAGFLKVDQIPNFTGDPNNNVSVNLTMSVNGFFADPAWNTNRADYVVAIGDSSSDDVTNGVLLASVAQNGRNNVGSNLFHVTSVYPLADGRYQIGTWGIPVNFETSPTFEDNVNVAAAWFPYSKFYGGMLQNSTNKNGGIMDQLIGTPGLVLGKHVRDLLSEDDTIVGQTIVDLREFGINSQTDGVLIVNHAKNEDAANFALSQANADGTWTVFVHDTRANGIAYEQDPMSFVFIPKSNTNLISGRFLGDTTIDMYSGSAPQFAVTKPSGGNVYQLRINGYTPADGILLVSPSGNQPWNGDNIVTYQALAAGDGWTIGSRDLPQNNAYQNMYGSAPREPVASFVFIPVEKPGFTVTPTNNILTTESGGTAQFTVTLNGYPKPTNDVTISITSGDETEVTVSPSSLTFTPADWNVAKTVTLTGVDDSLFDGIQPFTINAGPSTSADLRYDNLTVPVVYGRNADNEAGITVNVAAVETSETGTTATYEVSLNSAPTANVSFSVTSSDTTEATVSPSSVTFNAGEVGPKTVTVTGVDDGLVDGNVAYTIVNGTTSSADPAYNNLDVADVAGINVDNDKPGIVISALPLTISEPNTTATFTVVLSSQPTANVTINSASSDTTEGTVTPASVTFTPANWNVPQTVTVRAVDDLDLDGAISFMILNTVTSADAVYAAIDPVDVPVTTLDNEALVVLPSGDMEASTIAKGIDGYASITDPDTADYNGGKLIVSITANGNSSDRLAIRNDGTGAGKVSVSGSTVSFGGTAIGTFTGGSGTTPLTVTLNGASTPENVQALMRAVTYNTVDAAAANQTRTAAFRLEDGKGGVSIVSKAIAIRGYNVVSFQQDGDGGFGLYSGAADGQIAFDMPSVSYPQGLNPNGLWIDWNTLALLAEDQSQAMVRFTNIFGTGPGQIPPGSKIMSAQLVFDIADSGHGTRLNRMLIDWDPDWSTWNSFSSGIQLDDTEAVSGTNTFLGDRTTTETSGVGPATIGVRDDVQAWSDGASNYGWVMTPWPNGANGTAFTPCESTNIMQRPKLVVAWMPAGSTEAVFQQGLNSYTGTVDTQLHPTSPTNQYATSLTLSADNFPAGKQSALVRFDNIVGTSAGQLPPRANIRAAFLDLTSIHANSQGDGGQIFAMLQPWSDTNTWDFWVAGVTNDGVEAALTATADIGHSDISLEVVRSTVNSFEVTSDVQAWVNGTLANNGWVILPWATGNDGWGFSSSETTAQNEHPRLRVYFEPGVVLLNPVRNGNSLQIPMTGVAGRTYTVQRTTSVTGGWSNIGTVAVGSNGTGTITDNTPPAGSAFYRVVYP